MGTINYRTKTFNGKQWHRVADLRKTLKLQNVNSLIKSIITTHIKYQMEPAEKHILKRLEDTKMGQKTVVYVDDVLLFEIVFSSKTKKALEFRNKVFSEILPQNAELAKWLMKPTGNKPVFAEKGVKFQRNDHQSTNYSKRVVIVKKKPVFKQAEESVKADDVALMEKAYKENQIAQLKYKGMSEKQARNYLEQRGE